MLMYGEGSILNDVGGDYQPCSIVIPAHNEANYIGETINALNRAINSLELVAEIIVVNDASTDDTARIARELKARVVDVELRNIGAVRNAGAHAAVHPWIVFVDADTLVPAETLAEAFDFLAKGGVGGGARVAMNVTAPLPWVKWMMYYSVVAFWQVFGGWAAGCFMFGRKTVFDSFGGFDETYFAAEEYFFSREMSRRGSFKLVRPAVLTSARKLYKYSNFELIRFVWSGLLSFGGGLKSRRGLGLLYEDER